MIANPILPGFNPDPSIVRVDGDYFIATSTFEWFPGVQIHHSKDLKNWRLLTRPLAETRLLDLKGAPNSGGIWAPCLTYSEGLFYLCYTNVRELNSATKDTPNYLTTTPDIMGPWSDPVYLNSSGFDPSLFHDDDGRKWLTNMVWDHRPGRNLFYGIVLQEYDVQNERLIGNPELIFKGTELGFTEGPHLYRRGEYYYLLTAEGGTGYDHAVTIARSRSLQGPYEVHPNNPILTSRGNPDASLQKAGHADLVETQDEGWYMVHLASRPLPGTDRCTLGRETAIQRIEWRQDWPYVTGGNSLPKSSVPALQVPDHPWPEMSDRDDFDEFELRIDYQSLRVPMDDSYSLRERKGFLRLYGAESLESKFSQALLARRQEDFECTATTAVEFSPDTFQQMAGLVCYYSTKLFFYLYLSRDELAGNCLQIHGCDNGEAVFPLGSKCVSIGERTRVHLRASIDRASLQFSYSEDGERWTEIGPQLDASILSDDYGDEWGFTGAFVGIACQDLTGSRQHADFDYFEYRGLDSK